MHWIERHILKELAVADSQTYSELLPHGTEGNLFQYHARALEKAGYIIRSSEGYRLSVSGQRLVGTMSLTRSMRASDQPTPVVMIYALNDENEILLFEWRRQPYRGLISLPFGRLLRGRGTNEMALEQLRFKTGYQGKMTYIGLVELHTNEFHLLITMFKATELTGTHGSDGLTGTSFWHKSGGPEKTKVLPGHSEIMNWIDNSDRPMLLEIVV